jgi:hypothetical protein
MKYVVLFILSVTLPVHLNSQMLSPEELKADFQIFRKALEARHPEMYTYTTQKEFSDLFDQTLDSLNSPMSRREFYVTMSPLIVALRCGHTKWLVRGKDMYYPFFEENLFPLALHFHDQKASVTGSFTGEKISAGGELISINGENLKQIMIRLLNNLSFGDGYSMEGKYYQLNNFFPGIYSTFYGASPVYDVKIESEGIVRDYNLKGVRLDEIRQYQNIGKAEDGPFKFELIDSTTALLDINRFFTYPGEGNYHKFLKYSFREIESKGVNDLIIDLRGNEGGNENWGIELYRYLAREPFRYYDKITVKKKKADDLKLKMPLTYRAASVLNRKSNGLTEFTASRGLRINKPFNNPFRGTAWLLLDGQSFSVATEFAGKAKSERRCIVVGTETAGGYSLNSSGFFTIINLPNSGIDLGIPLLGFHTAVAYENNPADRGVIPDHIVKLSPGMYTDGKDHVMEFTLNLIRKEKLAGQTERFVFTK